MNIGTPATRTLLRGLQTLQRLADFDARLFLGINRLHSHLPLAKAVRVVSFTGDGYLYGLMGVLVLLLRPEWGTSFLMAGLLAFTAVRCRSGRLGVLVLLLRPEWGTSFLMAGLLAFLLELPLYWVLRRSFKRRRPFHVVQALAPLLKPSDEFSFPSGHTTAA